MECSKCKYFVFCQGRGECLFSNGGTEDTLLREEDIDNMIDPNGVIHATRNPLTTLLTSDPQYKTEVKKIQKRK